VYSNVVAGIRTIFHGGFRADGELAFNLGVVINQEFNNVHVFAFCDFKSERRVIDRGDLPESDCFRRWLRAARYKPVGNRRGPSRDSEASKEQSA